MFQREKGIFYNTMYIFFIYFYKTSCAIQYVHILKASSFIWRIIYSKIYCNDFSKKHGLFHLGKKKHSIFYYNKTTHNWKTQQNDVRSHYLYILPAGPPAGPPAKKASAISLIHLKILQYVRILKNKCYYYGKR